MNKKQKREALFKKVVKLLREGLTDIQARNFMEAMHEDPDELWYQLLQEAPDRVHPRWREQ